MTNLPLKRPVTVLVLIPLTILVSRLAFAETSGKYDQEAPHLRAVLQARVTLKGTGSTVDYAGLKADPNDLDAYVKDVEAVSEDEFSAMKKEERLAFLINAYNAFSLKMVSENFPVKSFSAIGGAFANPWRKKSEFMIFGKPVDLDKIETKMIGDLGELRAHFAVCKAAKDAPRLLNEPYLGTKLGPQLAEAARVFITDRLKNGYTPATNSFEVSQLFRWYKVDFEKAPGADGSLARYLAKNFELDPPLTEPAIKNAVVKFVDFDWALNVSAPSNPKTH